MADRHQEANSSTYLIYTVTSVLHRPNDPTAKSVFSMESTKLRLPICETGKMGCALRILKDQDDFKDEILSVGNCNVLQTWILFPIFHYNLSYISTTGLQ